MKQLNWNSSKAINNLDLCLVKKTTRTVLVGEDIESTMHIISSILKKEGYEVLHARTGEEVVNKAISHNPDVILLDLILPKRNGINTLAMLRSLNVKSKICISSIIDQQETINQALILGANDYIIKPISPGILTHKVNALMSSRHRKITKTINCHFFVKLKYLDSTLTGYISKISKYSIFITSKCILTNEIVYKIHSESLNKILEHSGLVYARQSATSKKQHTLELLGLKEHEHNKLENFIQLGQTLDDFSMLN